MNHTVPLPASSTASEWRLGQLVKLGLSIASELRAPAPQGLAKQVQALQELCLRVARAHGLATVVEGVVPNSPCVLVANHLGYLDPLILCSVVRCSPIAKAEVREWPLVGSLTERYATNFVRRGDAHSGALALRRARRMLEAGISVLNFPEGTTTRGHLRPFQAGVFGMAQAVGVRVVPVTVSFENRDCCWVDEQLLLPHYLKLLRLGAQRITVHFGEPLDSGGFSSAVHMADAARNWIQGQLRVVWPELRSEDTKERLPASSPEG